MRALGTPIWVAGVVPIVGWLVHRVPPSFPISVQRPAIVTGVLLPPAHSGMGRRGPQRPRDAGPTTGGFELARLRWPRRQPPRATAGSSEGSAEMGRRGADPDNGSGGRLARAWRWLQSSGFGDDDALYGPPQQDLNKSGSCRSSSPRPSSGEPTADQPPHPADRRWPGSVDAVAPTSAACRPGSCSRDEPHPPRPCPKRAPSSGSPRSPTVNTGQTEWSLICISARRWMVGQCFPSSRCNLHQGLGKRN